MMCRCGHAKGVHAAGKRTRLFFVPVLALVLWGGCATARPCVCTYAPQLGSEAVGRAIDEAVAREERRRERREADGRVVLDEAAMAAASAAEGVAK